MKQKKKCGMTGSQKKKTGKRDISDVAGERSRLWVGKVVPK